MRDTIPGSVYVEAFTLSAVSQFLTGIPGILRTRDQMPRSQPISIDDRVPLLAMSDAPAVSRGSWVRLKTRGLHRNDLGFVLDMDERLMDIQVAVVPRIQLRRKRVKRPEPSLFNLEEVKALYGNSSVEQRNQIHVFKEHEYKNGLLELSVPVVQISARNVNPTQSELQLFSQCADSSIVDASYREMVQFRLDDRIEVIAGQLRRLEGRLADTEHSGTVVIRSTVALDPQPVRILDIRKKFRLGDRVRVISGDHQGAEGFIISMDGNCAILYCPPSSGLYSMGEGIEVSAEHAPCFVPAHYDHQLSVDVVHIDFDPTHYEGYDTPARCVPKTTHYYPT